MFNLLAPRFIEHDYQQGEAGGAHDHRHAQGLAKPTKVYWAWWPARWTRWRAPPPPRARKRQACKGLTKGGTWRIGGSSVSCKQASNSPCSTESYSWRWRTCYTTSWNFAMTRVTTKRIEKENSSTNLQNTLLQRSSPNKTQGGRLIVISPNALIQAATKNSQMFEAMDPKN